MKISYEYSMMKGHPLLTMGKYSKETNSLLHVVVEENQLISGKEILVTERGNQRAMETEIKI